MHSHPLIRSVKDEQVAALRGEVQKLHFMDRQIVVLHCGAGLSQFEISKTLSLPQRTVSNRIERFFENIRIRLPWVAFDLKQMNEAICGGVPVPSGIYEKVMRRISQAGDSVQRQELKGKTP